jgi:hypothetical protein
MHRFACQFLKHERRADAVDGEIDAGTIAARSGRLLRQSATGAIGMWKALQITRASGTEDFALMPTTYAKLREEEIS